MEKEPAELTAKQLRAIEALLTEPTTSAAAKAVRVAESTVFRWLNDPAFSEAYRQARTRLLESTLTRLQAIGGAAVEALREVLSDPDAPAAAKISAARTVLEFSLRSREELETEQRLAAIEAALKLQGQNQLWAAR